MKSGKLRDSGTALRFDSQSIIRQLERGNEMTESKTEAVTVYVRLCADREEDCRELGFRIPKGITQLELLNADVNGGFAIDGNSATTSVVAYTEDLTGTYVPLSDALRACQLELVSWLSERGYDVEFK